MEQQYVVDFILFTGCLIMFQIVSYYSTIENNLINNIQYSVFQSNDFNNDNFTTHNNINHYNMSNHQSPQQVSDIKSQLRNFINLLQTTNPAAYKSMKSSGKLSVILSASQPQSSSMDKQNSSQSANLSVKNSEFHTTQTSLISQLIKQLHITGLNKLQSQLVSQLTIAIDQIIKRKQLLQNRSLLAEDQLLREKRGTDEILQALIKLDQQQKDLWNTYYQLSDKYKQKSTELENVLGQNAVLKQQLQGSKKEIKFLKNLVYLANQNYEELEEKHNMLVKKSHLESRKSLINKPVLVLRQKRSENNLFTDRSSLSKRSINDVYSPHEDNRRSKGVSPDCEISSSCSPLKKSSISIKSKKSISPLQRDKQNIECNFKDVYRSMLMKNLKSKKKTIHV